MIDLHTHTFYSDGVLIPSELVRRFEALDYEAVALTDHTDSSNIDFIIPRILQVAEDLNRAQKVKVVPGVEITHVPPGLIGTLVKRARDLGAQLVVVHGETIVEPVARGTNRAGLEAGADIIAHPGLITEKEVALAAEKGVYLEITSRGGHSLSNGYVARLASQAGAKLILNSDSHAPGDFLTRDFAQKIVQGAGIPSEGLDLLLSNARELLEKIGCGL
jgi:histidinol phosphatase-like PHP family hydrolase